MAHVPDKAPVACTDDVSNNPDYQTGREVLVEDMLARPRSQDLDTDAERVQQTSTPPQPTRKPPPQADIDPDKFTIAGPNCTITGTGLMKNLPSGAKIQVGHTNVMNIGGDGDSSEFMASQPKRIRNKRNITESQAEPTHDHLDIVSRKISGDWQRLGRELGLPVSTLEQIRLDYHVNGTYEINFQMLRKWKEVNPSGTVQGLALALATIGRGDIADHLSEISPR